MAKRVFAIPPVTVQCRMCIETDPRAELWIEQSQWQCPVCLRKYRVNDDCTAFIYFTDDPRPHDGSETDQKRIDSVLRDSKFLEDKQVLEKQNTVDEVIDGKEHILDGDNVDDKQVCRDKSTRLYMLPIQHAQLRHVRKLVCLSYSVVDNVGAVWMICLKDFIKALGFSSINVFLRKAKVTLSDRDPHQQPLKSSSSFDSSTTTTTMIVHRLEIGGRWRRLVSLNCIIAWLMAWSIKHSSASLKSTINKLTCINSFFQKTTDDDDAVNVDRRLAAARRAVETAKLATLCDNIPAGMSRPHLHDRHLELHRFL